jgi:hypothetical protein
MSYRIRCTDRVCKPAEGAVVKSYGAERSVQVRVKKLNNHESLLKCRKDSLQTKAEVSPIEATNCNGNLFTGYRSAGIKATGALLKAFIRNVRGCLVDVRKLCRNYNGSCKTVDQRKYGSYCNSILPKAGEATESVGRSHSSEEVFVMKMERRTSVIQSQYFRTTPIFLPLLVGIKK